MQGFNVAMTRIPSRAEKHRGEPLSLYKTLWTKKKTTDALHVGPNWILPSYILTARLFAWNAGMCLTSRKNARHSSEIIILITTKIRYSYERIF